MAAPKENVLCLGRLTGTKRNTFPKQREHSLKQGVHRPMLFQMDFSTPQSRQHLKAIHLQQRWQELMEREHTAQQHNRQLLQQFDRAQDTLREILARHAAMKTIRMEYDRYMEESAPCWQQQLKKKTQATQRKWMEEYLRSRRQNSEEQLRQSSSERLLLSQEFTKKPQTVAALHDNNLDVSSHLPCRPSPWLTSQTAGFPVNRPRQPQSSSHVPPPSIFSHPHQSQVHQLASSSPGPHPLWPQQDPPGWASPLCDNHWSWTTVATGIPAVSDALWRQLHTEEPADERRVEAETRSAASSKTEGGGGSRSSHCSQELDINPVRLSSGHAESSGSCRDSSQASREKRKRREARGKPQRSSSGRGKRSSLDSSGTSSAIVIAGDGQIQSSESDASSSEKRSTSGSRRTARRSGGLAVGSPPTEVAAANERTQSERDDSGSHREESHSTGEEPQGPAKESRSEDAKSQSPEDRPGSLREEESESVSVKTENGDEETDDQESGSSAEGKDEEEEEHKIDLGEGAVSQREEEKDVKQVKDDDEDVSARKRTTEEDEETGAEDDWEDQGDKERLKDEDGDIRKHHSSFSQDEDTNEEDESKEDDEEEEGGEGEEEDEEGSEEEEGGEGEEEDEEGSGSEDSIISPQENRPKKIQVVQEEAAGDDDEKTGSKTGSSDEDEFSEEDIENLLAPQEETKRVEKDLKVDKPKAACDQVEIFPAKRDGSTKTDPQSDSDEFDHFYD